MSKKKKVQHSQGSCCCSTAHDNDRRPIHILRQALRTLLYYTFILEPCQRADDFPRSQIC